MINNGRAAAATTSMRWRRDIGPLQPNITQKLQPERHGILQESRVPTHFLGQLEGPNPASPGSPEVSILAVLERERGQPKQSQSVPVSRPVVQRDALHEAEPALVPRAQVDEGGAGMLLGRVSAEQLLPAELPCRRLPADVFSGRGLAGADVAEGGRVGGEPDPRAQLAVVARAAFERQLPLAVRRPTWARGTPWPCRR